MSVQPLRAVLAAPPAVALRDFMAAWHGAELAPAAHRGLALFHAYIDAVPESTDLQVLSPADDDDRAIFAAENQAVYQWSLAAGRVEGRFAGAEWREQAPDVVTFVLQLALFDAARASEHGAVAVQQPPERAAEILDGFTPLDLPAWDWPGHPATFHAADRAVAFVNANTPDTVDILIGALDAASIRFVEPLLDETWEHYSGSG